MRTRSLWRHWSVALGAALCGHSAFLQAETARPPATSATAVPAARASTATVSWRALDTTYDSLAMTEAERQSTVSAQVSGRITAIYFRAGDSVRQGQVIMRIDQTTANQEVAGMSARVHEAEVQLDNASKQYQRLQELFTQKYVSQAQLDKGEADFKTAQAQLATLRAGLAQSHTQRGFAEVVAPYSGVMSALLVEVGEMAAPGRPLATGYDPSSLRVTAQIPQTQVEAVRRGARAWIEIPGRSQWLSASSLTVLPAADPRTHTTEVRVSLPDQSGLLPGQLARVHFVTGTARRLVVPSASLLHRSELTAVYVLANGGKPQLRQVRTGSIAGDFTEILAGLAEGEQVLLNPASALLGS